MTGLRLVGGATAGLVALSLGTARRPAEPVPDLGGYFDRWSALHGGYDARDAPLVRGWLTGAYAVARPLARVGVLPDVLTLWGLAAGGLVVALADRGGRWPLAAGAVVVGSGLLDNLDGCVAVLTGRSTRFGYVLDSLADRLVDGAYLVALARVGAPPVVCVLAGSGLGMLEYTRARAGNAGMVEIGAVTVGERPTRIIVTAIALGCAGVYRGYAPLAAGLGAAATLGVSTAGLAQLLLVVRRALAD